MHSRAEVSPTPTTKPNNGAPCNSHASSVRKSHLDLWNDSGGGGAWEFREMDELDKTERTATTTSARSAAAATSNAATRRFRLKCLPHCLPPLPVHR